MKRADAVAKILENEDKYKDILKFIKKNEYSD